MTGDARPSNLADMEERMGVRLGLRCTTWNYTSQDVCYVFEELSSWNRCLWYVGLQLRELSGPGELSLVRVRDQGCGHEQEARSRDGRVLFHALLTRHRCVVSLDLDEAIIEGGELGECRDLVVGAFQQNSSVRKLNLGAFHHYDIIRQELFDAIAAKTHLQELVFAGSGEFPGIVNPLRTLLLQGAANISTLSMPGVRYNEEQARNLVTALKGNDTILELSVHISILCSLYPDGTVRFSRYLTTCRQLLILTVTGDVDKRTAACEEVRAIVDALVPSGSIMRLKLTGFILDDECAYLLSRLVARNCFLEYLDIIGCQWVAPSAELALERAAPAFSKCVCSWIEALNENTTLTFLAINLSGLTADDFGVFFQVLMTVESLREVIVSGIAQEDLPHVGRAIRDAGMRGKVSIRGQYLASSTFLSSLEDCPEVLRHVAASSARAPSVDVFRDTLRQLMTCCWSQVTTLRLFVSQEAIDLATVQAMHQYLNEATALKELEFGGVREPDLSLFNGEGSHHPLLDALFSSPSVRTLHVWRLRFGHDNLRFLAEAVLTNQSLCEFYFCSCDPAENTELLRSLAPEFAENETMQHMSLSGSMGVEAQEERAIIQDVLGRNMGFVTCAANFVVNDMRARRCAIALNRACESSALISKVQEMALTDESEAMALIQSMLPFI